MKYNRAKDKDESQSLPPHRNIQRSGRIANQMRHETSRGNIANVLKAAGLEQAPARRNGGMSFRKRIGKHWQPRTSSRWNCGQRED